MKTLTAAADVIVSKQSVFLEDKNIEVTLNYDFLMKLHN